MRNRRYVFIFFVFLTPHEFCRAEENKTDEAADFTMEEVIVTATKTEEKRKDIPNSVIVIDEIDIQRSPEKTLGGLLANELGVDLRAQGNYGGAAEEIHIRGMSGNATQVLVNGVSVNSPSLGTADVGRIPLNNIERIEVVKGSGSLLYGSGAMGGTINIITKRPHKETKDAIVSAGYGSEDTYQVSVGQGMFVWGDFGYFLTANRRETDGFRDNSDLTHNDASIRLVLDKGDSLDISLYGDYIDREYGRPGVMPPEGTQDFFISGVKFYNNDAASLLDRGADDDGHLVLQIKSQPTQWVSYLVKGDYAHIENYNYQRYNSGGTGSETWTTNKALGSEGNIDIKPFNGATVLLGAEYKDYDWENKSLSLDASGAQVPGTETIIESGLHTKGAFAEAQYRPSKVIKALAGLRREDHSTFGHETIPRYGLIFNPLEETALKVSHGKHFLAPTPNDLFWPREDWGFGMGVEGNPGLRPEVGWHSDITLEQTLLRNSLFLTLSYFYWDMENRILWADNGAGFWSPINLRGYEADGLETGARIGAFFDFTLYLNYTYLDAEEEAEEYSREIATPQKSWMTHRATYSPEHQFKGRLVYESAFDLTAVATVRYVSDRLWYRDETTNWVDYRTVVYTLDSYWTADVKLARRLYDHWSLSFTGGNLFNKEYDTYFGSFMDQTTAQSTVEGFPGAGRSIFFSLAYEY